MVYLVVPKPDPSKTRPREKCLKSIPKKITFQYEQFVFYLVNFSMKIIILLVEQERRWRCFFSKSLSVASQQMAWYHFLHVLQPTCSELLIKLIKKIFRHRAGFQVQPVYLTGTGLELRSNRQKRKTDKRPRVFDQDSTVGQYYKYDKKLNKIPDHNRG